MKKLFTLLIVTAALGLWAIGCSSGDEKEDTTLKIALLPIMDTLPFYVAEQNGHFADAGIQVELVPVKSPTERDALMQAREVDGMLTDLPGVGVFNRDEPGEFVMLRLGNSCVELFDAATEDETAQGGEQPVGFRHVAFEVDDLDAVVAGLNADGIETDPVRDCSRFVPGMRVCFFNDPEGNRIELAEGYKDE